MSKIILEGNVTGTAAFTLKAPSSNTNRTLTLPDLSGTLSTMEQVRLPIGTLIWFTGTSAPEAFVVADGLLRSRAVFPDLWEFAQSSGNISVDDASWTPGQYSPGDGSTTFRIPKVDDRFIRGASGTRDVGLVEEDAIQGHMHDSLAGAFGRTYNGAGGTPTLSNINGATADAHIGSPSSDGVNGTPRTANETRPKAISYLPCIKAYDVISDTAVLNAVAVVNDMARMLPRDENINLGVSVPASGTAIDFVGIPAGVKRITVMFDGVSTNGASAVKIQLGAGSLKLTGYYSSGMYVGGSNSVGGISDSNGLLVTGGLAGTVLFGGAFVLQRSTDLLWSGASIMPRPDTYVFIGGGTTLLSGVLDRIRITTVNGTDIFDAGTINIAWEF